MNNEKCQFIFSNANNGFRIRICFSQFTITFLPIIDLSPTDPTCIYNPLEFVINQAKSLSIRTSVL